MAIFKDSKTRKGYENAKQRMPKVVRVPGVLTGGGTYLNDPNYVLDKVSNKELPDDSTDSIKKVSTTDTASRTNNAVEKRKYLEEILGVDTTEASEYFENRYKSDGVLMNLGKLISDKMKENLNWKHSDDPRLPNKDRLGARARARLRFEGWYNEKVLWGDPYGYTEGSPNKPWYKAENDMPYKTEIDSLYKSSFLSPNFKNYHFNLGLGFGESMVINPPFQYNELDDPRTHPRYTKIGRVYVQKVLNHMPMIMVMPGKINYNAGMFTMLGVDFGAAASNASYIKSDNWFVKLVSAAWMGITDVVGTTVAFATSVFTGGRLVSFRQQINLFKRYFDNVITQMASNMGLMTPTGLYTGRWKMLSLTHILPGIGMRRAGLHDFGKAYRGNQMIGFMVNKSISCSESVSNSTRENPIMGEMNAESSDAATDESSGGSGFWGNLLKSGFNFVSTGDLSHLGGAAKSIGVKLGGFVSESLLIKSGNARISLPEVWDSSSFSRSYNISMTLYAPYGIPLCKLESWGPSLAFWLTASLPRQVGKFSYVEPFVLRIVMPGKFNVNFGIVESLTIDRGEEKDDWSNTDNMPKTLKLSISIKDFQPSIMLPRASRSLIKLGYEALFPASGFAEYMATICGLSLADQMDWKRRFGRAFRQWTAGWRRRVNADILSETILNINPVQHILGIFFPFGDTFDKVEVLEDKARLQEYCEKGVKAMKDGINNTVGGTDTGAFFNYPIRAIYRYLYDSNNTQTGFTGFVRAVGKIFSPKDTEKGFNLDKEFAAASENDPLMKNLGNVDSLNEINETNNQQ